MKRLTALGRAIRNNYGVKKMKNLINKLSAVFAVVLRWLASIFQKKEQPKPKTETFTMTMPEKIERALVGKPKKNKHPLHYAHFGSFSPVKPFARVRAN